MLTGVISAATSVVLLFAQVPTSTNYHLPSYDFGNGGTSDSSSTSYRLNGIAGSQSGDTSSSTNYRLNSGENPTLNANVTTAPTLSNPGNYYDRLQLILNTANNPSDTRYLIAISNDGFTTTRYVQADNSIGASAALVNYRTYTSFGGASGFLILGLSPSTSYQAKVKAIRGSFTENNYGPATAGVATVSQSLSFGLSTTLSPTPPFSLTFNPLTPGAVATANGDINLSLSTNGSVGGTIYLRSLNGALFSSSQSYSINSATADLAVASSGYGGQVTAYTQSSGGPIAPSSPYNGSSDNVGALATSLQDLLTSPSPISTATATLRLKARVAPDVPSASDYTDTLTLVAAINY